jgi:hypothetical protein
MAPISSADNDDIDEYEQFLNETAQHQPEQGIKELSHQSQGRNTTNRPQPDDEGTERNLPLRLQPNGKGTSRDIAIRNHSTQLPARAPWKKEAEVQLYDGDPYEPYDTAVDIIPLAPFGEQISRDQQAPEVDPELWKKDRLPWYFPKLRPKVAGIVLHMEAKEEIVDYPDLFAAIATLLVELVWVLADIQQNKEGDRIVMTTVRVQTYNNELKDTRIRGNMRGADLSLGDKVSFWGRRRHGVLFVKRGFNHTTKGVISTHSMGLIVPAIVVLISLVVGVYFAPTWLPATWQAFASSFLAFFSFLQVHPIALPVQKK